MGNESCFHIKRKMLAHVEDFVVSLAKILD